jgi:hypothetical protein
MKHDVELGEGSGYKQEYRISVSRVLPAIAKIVEHMSKDITVTIDKYLLLGVLLPRIRD